MARQMPSVDASAQRLGADVPECVRCRDCGCGEVCPTCGRGRPARLPAAAAVLLVVCCGILLYFVLVISRPESLRFLGDYSLHLIGASRTSSKLTDQARQGDARVRCPNPLHSLPGLFIARRICINVAFISTAGAHDPMAGPNGSEERA